MFFSLLPWLAISAFIFGTVILLSEILMPFAAGLAVAFLLDPIADRLESWGASRTLAVTILTTLFVSFMVLAGTLILPLLQWQVEILIERLPVYWRQVETFAQSYGLFEIISLPEQDSQQSDNNMISLAADWIMPALSTMLKGGLQKIGLFINLISLLLITPFVTFYLLRDWDHLISWLDSMIPPRHQPTVRRLASEIQSVLAAFVRGTSLVCIFLGTFYAIGLSAIGLDFSILIGLFAGAISFLPFFGSIIGGVLSTGFAFAQFGDWEHVSLAAAIFIIGQILEGNFLSPKLIGNRVRLHPVMIILALLAGGHMLGFLGLLLALPVAAILGVLARFSHERYLAGSFYRAPFQPPRG